MIEKHTFAVLNSDKPDKDLLPQECRNIFNMIKSREGYGITDKRELVKGTVIIGNADPVGSGEIIGSIEDRENRRLYFFAFSDTNNHSIYELDGDTEQISLIARTPLFNFQSDKPVSGIIADGQLVFTDDFNPMRYINVGDAKAGKYTFTNESEINYQKPSALYTELEIVTTTEDVERIRKDSYKFSYRIVYTDNSRSRLAHFSEMYLPLLDWEGNTSQEAPQARAYLPTLNLALVKEIQFVLQRNNDPNIEIFKRVKSADITGTTVTALLQDSDQTTFLPTSDVTQTFENIPRKNTTIEFKDNRIFFSGGEQGYDDNGTPSIAINSVTNPNLIRTAKNGGTYTVGITYEDKYGWKSPNLITDSVKIPNFLYDTSNRGNGIQIILSGTAPSWAVRWNATVKEEAAFEVYQSFPAYVLPAIKQSAPEDINNTANFSYIGDWQYKNSGGTGENARAIHLKFPTNVPFQPRKGMKVRFRDNQISLNQPSLDLEYPIDDVVGDKIYIDNANNPNAWQNISHNFVTVEVYVRKEVQSPVFAEIPIRGDVLNGIHQDPIQVWEGDNYLVDTSLNDRLAFIFSNELAMVDGEAGMEDLFGASNFFPKRVDDIVESPVHAVGTVEATETDDTQEDSDTIVLVRAYNLNYGQIDNDRSIIVSLEGESKLVNNEDVVLFSDLYIAGSLVNGMFNVGLLSEYRLGIESGRIIRLEDVGENTILSIHENFCNSIYIGRNVMKTGDNLDLVTLTQDVIGYHRRLKEQFGTTQVSSIVEIDGNVFFFDQYRRAVVRYGNNGLINLSEQAEFDKFFDEAVSLQNLGNEDLVVRGGFYREFDQYFISLQGDQVNYTLIYDGRDGRFTDFYDIMPTWMSSFGSKLVMFDNADTYLWNEGISNTFFGDAYSPLIQLVINQQPELEYIFEYFIINSDKPWKVTVETVSGQMTYTLPEEQRERERGKYYGSVRRDVTNTGAYPSPVNPRFTGAILLGQTVLVTITRDDNEPVKITEFMMSKVEKRGHLIGR